MKDTKDKIIELLTLSGKEGISGTRIAESLSLTRAAVWKAISVLREDGYPIEATTKGYRIDGPNDIINESRIRKYLNCQDYNITVLNDVDSTNSYLKQKITRNTPELTAVFSRVQTSGRGRMRRTFSSPRDAGLYMSVLFRPDMSIAQSLTITTAAAVAVTRAIEKVLNKHVGIKWVNDIYLGDKKVCGILTEASVNCETDRLEYAIVGIGINVFEPDGGIAEDLKDKATFLLDDFDKKEPKNKLAAAILDELYKVSRDPTNEAIADEFRRRSILDGKKITVVKHDEERSAVVIGIDGNCRLVVEYPDKTREGLISGEVKIKLQ